MRLLSVGSLEQGIGIKAGVQILSGLRTLLSFDGEVEGIKAHSHPFRSCSHLYLRDESGGLLVGCFEPMGKSIDPAKLEKTLPSNFSGGLGFEPICLTRSIGFPPSSMRKSRNCSTVRKVSRWMDRSCWESAETKFFLGCGMNSAGVVTIV